MTTKPLYTCCVHVSLCVRFDCNRPSAQSQCHSAPRSPPRLRSDGEVNNMLSFAFCAGDLDVLVVRQGAWTKKGESFYFIRNNGDGSFTKITGNNGDWCHWVVPAHRQYKPLDYPVAYCAKNSERHELRCCADTAAYKQTAETVKEKTCNGKQIWVGSDFRAKGAATEVCVHDATYTDAVNKCKAKGARLCTKKEVESGCTEVHTPPRCPLLLPIARNRHRPTVAPLQPPCNTQQPRLPPTQTRTHIPPAPVPYFLHRAQAAVTTLTWSERDSSTALAAPTTPRPLVIPGCVVACGAWPAVVDCESN